MILTTLLFVVGTTLGVGNEILLSAVFGVAGAFIIQLIKRGVSTVGLTALVLSIIVSVVLGGLAAYLMGEFTVAETAINSSVVFSLATIIYRLFIGTDSVTSV